MESEREREKGWPPSVRPSQLLVIWQEEEDRQPGRCLLNDARTHLKEQKSGWKDDGGITSASTNRSTSSFVTFRIKQRTRSAATEYDPVKSRHANILTKSDVISPATCYICDNNTHSLSLKPLITFRASHPMTQAT